MEAGKYLPYYKTILRLALPLLIGQVGNIAVSFADNIMVGHYSTEALASASFVNNVFNIALFACVGFTYGLTPIIGAIYARGENDRIGRMVRVGLRVNTVFTLAIAGLMAVLYFNLHRMGQPEHLLPLIRPYYLTVFAGMVPVCVFNVLAQWSYAINNTSLPTWVILGANVLNVAGNYLLIYGHFGLPEMGLFGAGVSTLTARTLGMFAILAVFFCTRLGKPYREGFMHKSAEKGEVQTVAKTGFPVAMQMTFESASFSGAAVMAGWLGAVELAAFQIVAISGMLGFCLYYSIGTALSIPVSHEAGRGDKASMRRSAWAGYHVMLVCMVIAVCLFIFGGRFIMGMFSNDEAVVSLAVSLLVPMVLYQLGDATQITFANALRGTSHVMPMLYIAFVSYIVVGLPVTYLFAFPLGMRLYGIILSFSVCLLLAASLFLTFFLRATGKKSGEKY